jgi:hypothetical protein
MKCLSRTAILLSIFLFTQQIALAETKTNSRISGTIINLSGSPLRNAIIKIIREVKQGEALSYARSDSHGFFKAIDLTPGIYHLQVSHQGYQPAITTKFVIDPGRNISLDIILQEFMESLSNDEDPRNWDLKTTMRSVSDRRLILRDMAGSIDSDNNGKDVSFYRSGAMSIASNTQLDGERYLIGSQASQSGVSSHFAFAEPVSSHGRMILTGQLDYGSNSFWRMRNTYNFRPDRDHDYKISAGYGQMKYNYPGSGSAPAQLLSRYADFRESGLETLAFGAEGSTRLLDILAVKYGFEYSRLHYGSDKNLFHPSIEILMTPSDKWTFKTSVNSRRESEVDTVVLPDGEMLNLAEPALITMVNNRINMSQITHTEVAAQRKITSKTDVEMAAYQDRMQGSGLPLMVTTTTRSLLTPATPWKMQSDVIEMSGKHPVQRGMRLTLKHAINAHLSGSVACIYGEATDVFRGNEPLTVSQLEKNLTSYMRQRYQYSITSRLKATIPMTKTAMLASVRWNSGNPLTPLDWFSDRMDMGTKATNFEIRQPIPLPEFLGTVGQWEVLFDMRNMLNQGREILQASNGEIVLNRNPRSVRFGFNLNFR